MTTENTAQKDSQIPGINFVVAASELSDAGINEILANISTVDCYEINVALRRHIQQLTDAELSPILLLECISGYLMEPCDPNQPFRPMAVYGSERPLWPADLAPEQLAELRTFAPTVSNPGLRSRIADVLWYRKHEPQFSAKLAVESYCQCIEQVRDGTATLGFGEKSPYSPPAIALMLRAATILYTRGLNLGLASRWEGLVKELLDNAFADRQAADYLRLSEIVIPTVPRLHPDIADQVEILAVDDHVVGYSGVIPDLWVTAAKCREKMHDEDGRNHCLNAAADQLEKMANLTSSGTLRISRLRKAAKILFNLPQTAQRRTELMQHVQQEQVGLVEGLNPIYTTVDIGAIKQRSIESVQGPDLGLALSTLACCDIPPRPEQLYDEAVYYAHEAIFSGILPVKLYDYQGRLVFQSHGYTLNDNEQEKSVHLRYMMSRLRVWARRVTVAGVINPIRQTIATKCRLTVDGVSQIIDYSTFIPDGYTGIYAQGIVNFLRGEDVQAASLLVPQLENSLRHVLASHGYDATTTDKFGIQREVSLKPLLDENHPNQWRSKLSHVIPPPYLHEIDLLFDFAGGPAVRHHMAHAKLSAGDYKDENIIYATWLVIHLALMPVINRLESLDPDPDQTQPANEEVNGAQNA